MTDPNALPAAPTSAPAAPPPVDIETGEETPPPVDIEIADAETVPGEAPAAAPTADTQPGGEAEPPKPLRRRVSQWKQTAEAAATRAAELERELAELRPKYDDLAQKYQVADQAALTNFEQRVTTAFDVAKREVKEAMASGDPDRIANAQAALSLAAAEKSNLDTWKANQPKRPADAPAAERQPTRQPAAGPAPDPATAAWIGANPWFQPNHPEYDREMANNAILYANLLEDRMRRAGRANEIAGPGYWAEIDKHLKTEFPDAFGDEPPAPARGAVPGMKRVTPPVAGAVPAAPAAPTPSKPRVTLSAEEQSWAMNLGLKHPDGRPYSRDEALKAYAKSKWETEQRRAAQKENR